MRLGEFGAAQRELDGEPDDFVFFDETFVVLGSIPAMLMLQLAAAATGKIDESEGMAAMWEALRCSLTKPATTKINEAGEYEKIEADGEQFNRLYKIAVERNCEIDALMRLVFKLFEVQGGRPTQPASGSSRGPSPTSPSSSTSVTHPALSHLRSVDDLVKGSDPPALTG